MVANQKQSKQAPLKPLSSDSIDALLAGGPRPHTDALVETIRKLRLERDVLALNFGDKEAQVFVIRRGNRVDSVHWNDHPVAASAKLVNMPEYPQ